METSFLEDISDEEMQYSDGEPVPHAQECQLDNQECRASLQDYPEHVDCKRRRSFQVSQRRQRAQDEAEVPEDALLLVFAWLSPQELMRGPRGVSRTWRATALHARLWECQSLQAWPPGPLMAALCSLHCAGSLRMSDLVNTKPLLEMASVTECAVVNLELLMGLGAGGPLLLSIVRRQVELGRLCCLRVALPSSETGELLQTLYDAGLVELYLEVLAVPGGPPLPAPGRPPPALTLPLPAQSSISLLVFGGLGEDAVLEWLLEGHASTLRRVVVKYRPNISARALRLLAACPQLEEAELPGSTNLPLLADSKSLRSLTVGEWYDATPLVAYFMSAAARRLFSATLRWTEEPLDMEAMQVLRALAYSGSAELRELRLSTALDVVINALPRMLVGLSNLHTLELTRVPLEHALNAVTNSSAPSLRVLRFTDMAQLEKQCRDEDCCYPRLYRLVLRLPALHVMGLVAPDHPECSPDFGSCNCCVMGLHPNEEDCDLLAKDYRVSEDDLEEFANGLFGHLPSMACHLTLHLSGMGAWRWAGDPLLRRWVETRDYKGVRRSEV